MRVDLIIHQYRIPADEESNCPKVRPGERKEGGKTCDIKGMALTDRNNA